MISENIYDFPKKYNIFRKKRYDFPRNEKNWTKIPLRVLNKKTLRIDSSDIFFKKTLSSLSLSLSNSISAPLSLSLVLSISSVSLLSR